MAKTTFNKLPKHLPARPIAKSAFDELYAFNFGVDDYLENDPHWLEIRIRPGLSEVDVYRKLPSAADFEFGGYLTKTRIRYAPMGATRANTLMSKTCTFHSHPTDLVGINPDIPSIHDVYAFLKYRHLRAITVGANKIWVWDKTRNTVKTLRKLAEWETTEMLTLANRISKQQPHSWREKYMKLVLKELGLAWPNNRKSLERDWPELLRQGLGVKVRLFDRESSK